MASLVDKTDAYAPVFAKVLRDADLTSYLNFRSPVIWTRSFCPSDYKAMGDLFAHKRIPVYEFNNPKRSGGMIATYIGDSSVKVNRAKYSGALAQFYIVHETTHLIQDKRGKQMKHWEAEAEALFAEALATVALRIDPDDLPPLDRALQKIAKRYLNRRNYYESGDFRRRWEDVRVLIRKEYAESADQTVPFDGLRLAH